MTNRMARENPLPTKRERAHAALATQMAAQGMVLLENNGVLPFGDAVCTVALFGAGARRTVIGGTGSGEVNVRAFVSVEQGLANVGYRVVSVPWLDAYDAAVDAARAEYDTKLVSISEQRGAFAGLIAMMSAPFAAPAFCTPTEEELGKYPVDAAIYVLARNSGEGADRKAEAGDYYLTEQEVSDITRLSQRYRRFVLLMNVGGVVDLAPVKDLPGVGAILLIGQGGIGTGEAAAALISGKATPCGKLAATWAGRYADYPFADAFAGGNGDIFDAYYKEGIYVGYRYFDSFGVAPAYPFGYGLSYTDFSIEVLSVSLEGGEVCICAAVTNTGTQYTGREVVQVYACPPHGRLDKPHQTLAAFQKTKELSPGERQEFAFAFPLTSLACYDAARAAWVLEAGSYTLRCGSSSRQTEAVAVIELPKAVVTEQCKNLLRGEAVEALAGPLTAPFTKNDVSNDRLFHLVADVGSFTTVRHDYAEPAGTCGKQEETGGLTFADVLSGNASAEELTARLSAAELAALCVGAARINLADVTVVGNFSEGLPGAAGETAALAQYGLPSITMVDGPAGIRVNPIVHEKDGGYVKNPAEDPIFRHLVPTGQSAVDLAGTVTKYQYCTALPVATLLAQTWDIALLEEAGRMIGAEMAELGVSLWLAPGMNIQRNPLCGRNFEYYSEDPLLTGVCAAAVTRGVQSHPGMGATIKHLAANSQETNRNFNNSHISERALREIYLKGFEICVKTARPLAAMTALNLINGVHAAADHDLLTGVLRQEWEFDGVVMTDWGTTGVPGSNKEQKYDCTYAPDCMAAGNDLIMPGSERDAGYIENAIKTGELDVAAVRRCATNIICLLARTAADDQ